MKVIHLSNFDISGGAARAANRLHRALLDTGVDSRIKVRRKVSDSWQVDSPSSKLGKFTSSIRASGGALIQGLEKTEDFNLRTGNWMPSRWANDINISAADIVHLHWVAGETLSIEDIGRIKKTIVWTIHDMWPFCGTEHYAEEGDLARWRQGYLKSNRSEADEGFDLSRLAWIRKKKNYPKHMHIISPSNWLGQCAKGSALFSDYPVSIIPNPLDTDLFKPMDRKTARKILNIPIERKVILFGAIGGGQDPRKGFDLLIDAFKELAQQSIKDEILCVIYGQSEPRSLPDISFPIKWMGYINDDVTLAILYNAADVMVVPSRQENLPQTATEAQTCGCPVVAFNCTGLPDVVEHKVTGYLAEPYNPSDLAYGIRWVLEASDSENFLGINARERAVNLWSEEVVVSQYLDLYNKVLKLESIS